MTGKFPRVVLGEAFVDPEVIKKIPARVAGHYGVFPLGEENGKIRLAFPSPPDMHQLDELRLVLRAEVIPVLAAAAEIAKAVKDHYGIGAETLEKLAGDRDDAREDSPAAAEDLEDAQDASVIKIVNQILLEAYRNRATDIHIEPYADDLRVRYRIDGILYDAKTAESLNKLRNSLASRIKIMADLSIAEKRLPQDGRMKVRVGGGEMDLRVSTLPTPFGESIGIRLLTSRQLLDLPHLGFAEEHLKSLESYLEKPHGIVFLTGPTGSGKTTTLYAFLQKINTAEKKIITMEDPIEYQMKGITQVHVNPKIGLTFAAGLRSMLRHDPDVMMVGEVRDLETAEIAIRVALTGHLVFSTLHTNDAAGAVTRLQDIGLEPYLVSSSVLCIIAQRLVRLICGKCREPVPTPPEIPAEFDLKPEDVPAFLSRGKGCEACKRTGFRGRTVIYEILPLTPDIRDLVVRREPARVIRDKAVERGMETLRRCGWKKIISGLTTPDEVLRVTLQEGL